MTLKQDFWKGKTLAELDDRQWEALCDGCAQCCLVKLEDEDSGAIAYTDHACEFLDLEQCRCSNYSERLSIAPDCVKLSVQSPEQINWLPETCAYKRVAEGRDLPYWHYLVCGDSAEVHRLGVSVANRAIINNSVEPEQLQERVLFWVEN